MQEPKIGGWPHPMQRRQLPASQSTAAPRPTRKTFLARESASPAPTSLLPVLGLEHLSHISLLSLIHCSCHEKCIRAQAREIRGWGEGNSRKH